MKPQGADAIEQFGEQSLGVGRICAVEKQCIFLSSQSRGQIGGPAAEQAYFFGDTTDDLVTDQMPVGVVDGLEMVDIDNGQRHRSLVAAGAS